MDSSEDGDESNAQAEAILHTLASVAARDVRTVSQGGTLGAPDPASRAIARVSSMRKSGGGDGDGGGGGSGGDGAAAARVEQSPAEREALAAAKERGNKLFSSQLYGEAAAAYTEALRLARDPDDLAALLSNRSAAYASLSRSYRSRSARRSECAALFDLDPTSLAQMALKDADRAVGVKPEWAKAYSRQGTALFLLERFHDAREAYLEGLALEPTSSPLQEGLREVQAILLGDAEGEGGAAAAAGTTAATTAGAAAAGASPTSPGGGGAAAAAASKRQRTMASGASRTALDDWDCCLCAKLLFEPVTTPCGHTFCKECFGRAMDHKPRCPYCRTVLHVSRDSLPVSITLANILGKAFPEEYEERRREATGSSAAHDDAVGLQRTSTGNVSAGSGGGGGGGGAPAAQTLSLPLFVMSLLMPGETMALNVFEPRYRLMIRRVMEGSRRFGMGQARRDQAEIEDVAVEAEILECQPQPDGRYYLEVVGRRRVRILSHGELDGYRVGRCEPMQDTEPQVGTPAHAALPELVAQVERQVDGVLGQLRPLAAGSGRLHTRIRAMLEGLGDRPPASQPEKFSLWASTLAGALCPEVDKAATLRITDTSARLRLVAERLGARMAAGGGQGCCIM